MRRRGAVFQLLPKVLSARSRGVTDESSIQKVHSALLSGDLFDAACLPGVSFHRSARIYIFFRWLRKRNRVHIISSTALLQGLLPVFVALSWQCMYHNCDCSSDYLHLHDVVCFQAEICIAFMLRVSFWLSVWGSSCVSVFSMRGNVGNWG
mmetsp:Transcript_9192/g.13845  ORF Transcript_9192/g.13845 Transcript_9192/m.13845 type:complete len:151 (+) Transcript_9192:202-654(+)